MTPTATESNALSTTPEVRPLPSGRSVSVRVGPGGEEIVVRSPEGAIEVEISLTEQGPVVRLHAARLELAAADEVRIAARKIALESSEGTEVAAGGDFVLRSEGDARVNAKTIYLN